MKNQKGFILPIVIVVAVVALFGTAGYFGYQYYSKTQEQPKPIACTQDAKLCPNGSYVSRTGPNCEFAECPAVADQAAGLPVQNKQATEGWETYRNDEYGFEIKYPTDAKIKEVDKSISLVFADNQRKLNIEVIKNAESNECYKTAWAAELPDISIDKVTFKGIACGGRCDIYDQIQYCAIRNGIAYKFFPQMIQVQGRPNFVELDDILNQILSTFKFTE